MTQPHEPTDQQRADQLSAFGDALVDGHAPPASDDIEATLVRAQRAMRRHYEATSGMPEAVKHQIWEDLMTSTTAPIDQRHYIAPPRQTGGKRPLPMRGLVEPAVQTARRWQAALSFALVLAFLAMLVTLAWQQGTSDGPGGPTPTDVAAQGLYDPDDISSYPMMPEDCLPNGEVDDKVEPADRSIDDWVEPEYGPAKAVPHERGLAIQQTYMNYLRCEWDHFHPDVPGGGTPAALPVGPSPEMLTYFSDRLRYDRLYDDLSPGQQAELDEYRCMPRIDTILENFPLPVNQPHDYAILSLLPSIDEIDELAFTFSPSDVYLLPDGRYGAVKGTVTTAALDDPNAVTRDDHLLFIAFVEEDDHYFIDEMFTLFAPDMDTLLPNGRNGTILMNCD